MSYKNKITLLSRKHWQQNLKSCLLGSSPAGYTIACVLKVGPVANLTLVFPLVVICADCHVEEGGASFSHLVPEHYFFSLALLSL